MVDSLVKFLVGILKNDYLTVLFVSMFPLVELKGAIPVGQAAGLPLIRTACLSYIGSSLICIPLFFLLIPVFNLLKKIKFIKKFVEKVEGMLYGKAKNLPKKRKRAKSARNLAKKKKMLRQIGLSSGRCSRLSQYRCRLRVCGRARRSRCF